MTFVQIVDLQIQNGCEQVDALEDIGVNNAMNKKYEAYIPNNFKKPNPDSLTEERSDFIRRKYVKLQFTNSDDQTLHCPFPAPHRHTSSSPASSSTCYISNDKKHYEKLPTRQRIGQSFRNRMGRNETDSKLAKKNSLASMVEFVGLIKVNVVKGINLVIRDVLTSDPYVILVLGHQFVYDKDKFTFDEFMGEAEVDLQPLVAAARAYENWTMHESVDFEKWVSSKDNTSVEDGVISLVDGKLKQEIILQLQKVESGALEIELECVPLTQ